jgi:hypothetical protein
MPDKEGLATRVMGSINGQEFQICEMEGTDVLADVQGQEDDFRWAVVYQATHSRVARKVVCQCGCGHPIEAGKTDTTITSRSDLGRCSASSGKLSLASLEDSSRARVREEDDPE